MLPSTKKDEVDVVGVRDGREVDNLAAPLRAAHLPAKRAGIPLGSGWELHPVVNLGLVTSDEIGCLADYMSWKACLRGSHLWNTDILAYVAKVYMGVASLSRSERVQRFA